MSHHFVLNLLAYLVPTFVLGFVWHLQIFDATYRELDIYRADVIIPFGFASMLIQGMVFAMVYPHVVVNPQSMRDGAQFAAGAALLSWSFTTLAVAAKHRMTSVRRFVVIETAFTIVQFAIVGPLLALTS